MTLRLSTLASDVGRDARHAIRRLLAAPAFAVFSIATLALAIGITTAVYSVVYHFLGIDYGIEDRAHVYSLRENGVPHASISRADYDDIATQQQSFESLAAWGGLWTNLSAGDVGRADTRGGSADAMLVRGEVVSGNY